MVFSPQGTGLPRRVILPLLTASLLACGDGGSGPETPPTPSIPDPPAAPSDLTATARSTTRIDLTWTDFSSIETGFHLERSLSEAGGWAEILAAAANTTSHSDTGLNPGTQYFYRVRANGAGGFSSYSTAADATTHHSPPDAPTELVATGVSTTQIDLTWTDNSLDEIGFHIQRSADGSLPWTEIFITDPNRTSFSDIDRVPSTEYFYRVKANGSGGYSTYSAVQSARTLDSPPVLTTIRISPDTAFSTNGGDQIQFAATGHDQRGEIMEGLAFEWGVGDGGVSTVNDQGLATVLAEGATIISARVDEVLGEASLLVHYPDEEYAGEPVTTTTDVAGETVILTASFGGRGVIVPVKDPGGAPIENAVVEYAEANGKPFVVVNGPGGLYVPNVFYDGADGLAAAGSPPPPERLPTGLQRAVLEGGGKAITLPSEVDLLSASEVPGHPGFYEIKKIQWLMGSATFSGCFTYTEIAQEVKGKRTGGFPDATFGLAFETAADGPEFRIKSAVMMGEALFGMSDTELGGAILGVGQGFFGMAAGHGLESPDVGLHFDFVDGSSAGSKLENTWVQYMVLPDDPRCRADLVAGTLAATPAEPSFDDPFALQGSITNAGVHAFEEPFSWRIEVDDVGVATGQESGLAAGATLSVPILAADLGPYEGGNHLARLIIDTGGSLAEANAANNTSSLSLYVRELGVGFEQEQFALVPPGTFLMGDENGHQTWEIPVHTVNITKEFYVQKTEVTQGQWRAVMGTDPSHHSDCGDTCPVEMVGWNDVQVFVENLNAMYPGRSYRLLTEAEWEYSARAGTTGDFGGTGVLEEMGWVMSNSDSITHRVAQKLPNAFGLYDMHGNVYEMASDWFWKDYYQHSPLDDPPGPRQGDDPVDPFNRKVIRGGSFDESPFQSRSAWRFGVQTNWPNDITGFRLARTK